MYDLVVWVFFFFFFSVLRENFGFLEENKEYEETEDEK